MRKNALIAVLMAAGMFIGGSRVAAQQPADDPRLDTRVSISYQNASAADVLSALARAGAVRMRLTVTPLEPVTVTLTNVKLGTALDAVCQNAGCTWRPVRNANTASEVGDILFLQITAVDDPLPRLPKTVSLSMHNAEVGSVFRALAAAIHVTLVLETDLTRATASAGKFTPRASDWNLSDADITGVLRLLCDIGNCSWELNEKTRTLRVFARKP